MNQLLDAAIPREDGTGFVGPDIPIDLLLATGRPFGHLPWSDRATPWADRWLESGFPFWARSIVEDWQAGRFDALSQVVFSRADDAAQRLYYYVRELQARGQLRGPRPLVFDCALIPRDSSLRHTAAAIREVAVALDVSPAALAQGVARGNTLRTQLATVQSGRATAGPFFEQLARAAVFSDPSAWIGDLELPAAPPRPRLLLAGSVPPDDRLHQAVEAGGASVVAEQHVHSLSRLGAPVSLGEEDIELRIARQLVANSIGPRSFVDRATALVTAAQAAEARAVVLWQTREEEALAWHVPAQRRALAAAGIPALVLASCDWRAADGALAAIEQFCRENRS